MSDSMNSNQVRVVDPVLTTLATGYRDPRFVGGLLFPRVPVAISGGQIITFDKSAFQRYNTSRAPGGATKRMDVGYLGKPYALLNKALEASVPREHLRDAKVMPGVDQAKLKTNAVMGVLLRELEIEQATLATTLGNYDSAHKVTLAGTAKWSNAASDPVQQVDGYKDVVRQTAGVDPNTGVFSPQSWTAFKNNPAVRDRIKYTNGKDVSLEIAAQLLGLEKVDIGKGIVADAGGTFSDIWGNSFVLAYTALGSLDAAEPSYGYTYTMEGHPMVEVPYWDNNTKSWIYGVSFERAPVLSGITSGFLVDAPA
ncbi:major capsid protein [Hydrocarboniphaga effusa]|uniref:major capsid protein n=1 Tax=Hydrocarboniphaga effusa TaxID=243629 RepID=UPI003BADAF68